MDYFVNDGRNAVKSWPKMPEQILVSLFNNCRDNQPKQKNFSWDDLAQLCSKPDIRADKDGSAFSPATFKEGQTRADSTAQECALLVFDLDNLPITTTALDVLGQVSNLRGFVYSSHSHHLPEKGARFRLVVALKEPMPSRVYKDVAQAFANKFFLSWTDSIDSKCFNPSRIFYLPSCPQDSKDWFDFAKREGEAFDWQEPEKKPAQFEDPFARVRQNISQPRQIKEGGRNHELFKIGCALRAKGGNDDAITRELIQKNSELCKPPLEKSEIFSIAKSVCRYEQGKTDQFTPDSVTELQVAQAVAARKNGAIHYVSELDSFVIFDDIDKIWIKDSNGKIVLFILEVLAEVKETAIAQVRSGNGGGAKAISAVLRSEKYSFVDNSARLVKPLPGIPKNLGEFDNDPLLVGLKGAMVLDLRTSTVRQIFANDYITKTLNATYDPSATCPQFDDVLQTSQPNPEIRRYIQKSLGYSLSGLTEVQLINFAYGLGANSKSVLLGLWLYFMGNYGRMIPSETLMERGGYGGVPNDIATLVGIRFALANELPDGRKWAETLLKQLSGGDRMVARYLFKEFFEFTPMAKIWVAGNHKPFVSGTDYGFWRRLALIPFGVTIPENERDPKLFEKLQKETSGILNWAIEGWRLYQLEGLILPDEIKRETSNYQADSDIVGQFIESTCSIGNFELLANILYASFKSWCDENGFYKLSSNSFGRKLTERGLESEKRGGVIYRKGLRLR